jgi:hypothetical protein
MEIVTTTSQFPVSGRMTESPADWSRYVAALAGAIPGANLDMPDRYTLITDLHGIGWSDNLIALHTRGTLASITAARRRLGLGDNGGGTA